MSGPCVAVLGGGLAGMAAAVALAERGLCVELFESRRRLGGRAASFRDGPTGRWIDRCQHVAMGCCTNLVDFCHRLGPDDAFNRRRRLHFIAPDARRYDFDRMNILPAPLHLAPGLGRLAFLRPIDRWRVAAALVRLARMPADADDQPVGPWLRTQGQSAVAIERFWSVVLASALSETLDRASLRAARKVFVDGFLASTTAHELLVPRMALAELFDASPRRWFARYGVVVHDASPVARLEVADGAARSVVFRNGSRREFDFFVLAVPWHRVARLLAPDVAATLRTADSLRRIEPSAITAVHLWFDRPVLETADAVLLGRLGQWVFQREEGYCQAVISASHMHAGLDRTTMAQRVAKELSSLPTAASARLLRWRVVIEPSAVFSVQSGVDAWRPGQSTAIGNLMLAGDWTATGWPGTMESAVRSGRLAAEQILSRLGRPERLLVDDLPRGRLARWLLGAARC